jgi:AmmeMemoRadiSam system protein A
MEEKSVYAKLARYTIEKFIREEKVVDEVPEWVDKELYQKKAGVFVSIHLKNGDLRGCIGTIEATQDNLVREIVHNAISAAVRDPRFPPLTEDELNNIVVNVDILSPPEPVTSISELDPKIYGVIVKSGYRRGLLLPDLEGVEDVETQLSIVLQKAGISPQENYEIYKFKVERYY